MSIVMLTFLTFAALVLHALFAGFEAALAAVDRIRIRHLAEEENRPDAKRLMAFVDSPDLLMFAASLGAAVSLIGGTVAIYYETSSLWIAFLIAAPAFLVFGEIIPRSLALIHPTRFVLMLLPYVVVFIYVFAVVAWPLALLMRGVRKLVGAPEPEIGSLLTSEEEFLSLVDESAAAGGIEKDEQEMIHSVLDLQTTQVQEIMVPRTDIRALPDTAPRTELVEQFEATGLTRLPIYHESLDDIIGVANVYDVLIDDHPENADIRRFARGLIYVPDTMPAGNVLQLLKEAQQHMAIVTDEYGGTDGIITLEDALEEIFGEIHDEHDRAMDLIRQVGPRGFVIDARMSLEELAEAIGVPLEDPEVETVAGWVMRAAGRIPDQGEKLKFEGFRVTVLEGQRNQVNKIRLDILDESYVAPADRPKEGATP